MMRKLAWILLLLPLPLFAQNSDPAKPDAADAQKPVAVVNGQTITAQDLDYLYDRLGTGMREQYEKAGGKPAFLENYVRKRLLIQEAMKSGFDRRPDVKADMEASKESTLFDRYVRDVVASSIVTDAMVRDYYDKHPDEFATPERRHIRHIVVAVAETGPRARSKEQALDLIKQIMVKLREGNTATMTMSDKKAAAQIRSNQFAQLARQYSEDPSGPSGGDLGWLSRDQLDPDFAAAAWALPVGLPSGIVETKFGYHLILIEGKQPAGTEAFEQAKASIREFLMTQKAADVMEAVTRLTNSLVAQSKVAIYPENIK